LNPDLPDQLCLPRRWLLHKTIRAALRLTDRE